MYYLNRYTIYLYSPEVGELFTQVSCILLKAIKGLELHLQAADTVHLGCVTGWRGHQSQGRRRCMSCQSQSRTCGVSGRSLETNWLVFLAVFR